MAARTTTAAGNWGSGSTWTGGVVPVSGDTVTISHAVTVAADATVGASPQAGAGTAAIRVNGTGGSLTVNAKLSVRGDLVLNNALLTIGAGGGIEFDASGATTPSTAAYVLQIGAAHGQSSQVVINGSSVSRSYIQSKVGGANARITDGGFIDGGSINANYCNFTRLGSSSTDSISNYPTNSTFFSISNSIFDACGRLTNTVGVAEGSTYILDGVTFKNSVGSEVAQLGGSGPISTGIRRVIRCIFDLPFLFYPGVDFSITESYFNDGFDVLEGAWAKFEDNFVRLTSQVRIPGDFKRNYFYYDSTSETNPHFVQLSYGGTVLADGNIFESACTSTGTEGDGISIGTPVDPLVATITNNIVLPNAASPTPDGSGTLVSMLGASNTTVAVNKNTGHVIPGSALLAVGETYIGFAGMVTSFKDNIAYDSASGRSAYKIADSGTNDNVSNLVSSGNVTNNAGFNLSAGSNGNGYDGLEFSSGSPGANDISGDPSFVDRLADLARWDQTLGGAGTVANALSSLRKRNDSSGYNSSYTPIALVSYIRSSFAPQNSAYATASSTGGYVGAVPAITAAAAVKRCLMMGI